MGSHRSVARSSLHTSLTTAPLEDCPPHTTSPGRVRSHSFAPCRAALHTLISRRRHAPTRSSPVNWIQLVSPSSKRKSLLLPTL
jgi:hypothetical protein